MYLHRLLPRPGTVWGYYPQKPMRDNAPVARIWRLGTVFRTPIAQAQRVVTAAIRDSSNWTALDTAGRALALGKLRARLQHEGLTPDTTASALAACMAYAKQTLGQTPRSTQCLAAALLLDQRMAEMATGEGKTLALALAAGVSGLAGIPVHVLTANDYLAARDQQSLESFFGALGLRSAALLPNSEPAARRSVYTCDVVYATAQSVAFDYLRDQQVLRMTPQLLHNAAVPGTDAPVMRGLCMALLDEADSILLDEADVPLILSKGVAHSARRAFLWQALALARRMEPHRDFDLSTSDRSVSMNSAGEARAASWAAELGGPWTRTRYRREALTLALRALHLFERDAQYLVRDGAIEILDEVTGRIAEGRVWSRGLHSIIAMKEGVTPPVDTQTVAQITFQRFFQRYWRLGGISGTLTEARSELRNVFGTAVVRVPLYNANKRQQLPPRCFDTAQQRWRAVGDRVSELLAAGRPVLVGTDSVADSHALAEELEKRQIPHQVLNALHHAQEAAIIARAGCTGSLTVATRMAGRGTDIELDALSRAQGGLHVISCQSNPSHRLDRQLAGRSGRQGDPGSVEFWLLKTPPDAPPDAPPGDIPVTMEPCLQPSNSLPAAWLALAQQRFSQWREDKRRTALRQLLLQQGRQWEENLAFAGSQH